jgi:hypothetical protein
VVLLAECCRSVLSVVVLLAECGRSVLSVVVLLAECCRSVLSVVVLLTECCRSVLSPRKAFGALGLITYRIGCFTFVLLGQPIALRRISVDQLHVNCH